MVDCSRCSKRGVESLTLVLPTRPGPGWRAVDGSSVDHLTGHLRHYFGFFSVTRGHQLGHRHSRPGCAQPLTRHEQKQTSGDGCRHLSRVTGMRVTIPQRQTVAVATTGGMGTRHHAPRAWWFDHEASLPRTVTHQGL